eukprot:14115513-Heterocapsa_arctica.AAC.1
MTIATRDDKLGGGPKGKRMDKASRSLSQVLRHDNQYIKPINMGGWFLCTDLYHLDEELNAQFIFNLVAFNGKQRFQLAVHTVDRG